MKPLLPLSFRAAGALLGLSLGLLTLPSCSEKPADEPSAPPAEETPAAPKAPPAEPAPTPEPEPEPAPEETKAEPAPMPDPEPAAAPATPPPPPPPAAPKEMEVVKVSLFSWPGYGFWFVAKERGLTDGFELDIQIIEDPYESFGQMAAGQLDVTSSTVEYGPIAADSGVPVKLVAYTNASYGTDKIILGPGVEAATDLKGKSVAVLEGGLTQIYMGIWLEQNGLKFDDVTYTNVIMDDAVAAMVSGSVAGGEFWEPFGTQVIETLEGSKIVSTSKDDYYLSTGLLADGMYMSGDFLKKKPQLAMKVMKAYFDAVAYWKEHSAEANKIIADAIKFEVADVVSVIGDTGGPKDGGLYVFGWPESSAFMGVAEGEPPIGKNGQIKDHWKLTNEWWVKFGMVKETYPPNAGIAFGPMKKLAESGYGK